MPRWWCRQHMATVVFAIRVGLSGRSCFTRSSSTRGRAMRRNKPAASCSLEAVTRTAIAEHGSRSETLKIDHFCGFAGVRHGGFTSVENRRKECTGWFLIRPDRHQRHRLHNAQFVVETPLHELGISKRNDKSGACK
jgi:hypothetical protein